MFFYAPFFVFVAVLILMFADFGLWVACAYLTILFGPRFLRQLRNMK